MASIHSIPPSRSRHSPPRQRQSAAVARTSSTGSLMSLMQSRAICERVSRLTVHRSRAGTISTALLRTLHRALSAKSARVGSSRSTWLSERTGSMTGSCPPSASCRLRLPRLALATARRAAPVTSGSASCKSRCRRGMRTTSTCSRFCAGAWGESACFTSSRSSSPEAVARARRTVLEASVWSLRDARSTTSSTSLFPWTWVQSTTRGMQYVASARTRSSESRRSAWKKSRMTAVQCSPRDMQRRSH
mmetsp:Transcript_20543/g.46605  ORF Transcript_20543/g.46605 Transcript_20543/m.46605 type:complete len:247 (-) Transcript_20543:1006-1746(-)